MAEITREYIAQKRAFYLEQIAMLNGAIGALEEIERDLFPAGALTLDDLAAGLGAQSAEITEQDHKG